MQLKRCLLLGALSLGLCYIVVSVSPIQEAIGRKRPDLAGLFSPLHFNFSATYTQGRVLGIHIGITKQDLFRQVGQAFLDSGQLVKDCVVRGGESLIPIREAIDVTSMYGGANRLCIFSPGASGGRMMVTFAFEGDRVSSVQIRYVRTEGF